MPVGRSMRRLGRCWRDFLADRQGANAILVAIAMIPMIGMIGLATDTGRGYLARQRLQMALDAGGLAAAKRTTEAEQAADLSAFFWVNYGDGYLDSVVSGPVMSYDENTDRITATATAVLPTTFMQVLGVESMTVGARTVVQRETLGMELILVMDNTGSMRSGGKINAMKNAAQDLIDILYGGEETIEDFWVGLVPYSASVNIGNQRSDWLTRCGTTDDPDMQTAGPLNWMNQQTYSSNGSSSLADNDRMLNPGNGIPYRVSSTQTNRTFTTANPPSSFSTSSIQQVPWANNWTYNRGYRIYMNGKIYESQFNHTSSSSGSFTQELAKSPARWAVAPCASRAVYFIDPTDRYTTGVSASAYTLYEVINGGPTLHVPMPLGWKGCVEERIGARGLTDDPPEVEGWPPYYWPDSSDNNWLTISNDAAQPQQISLSLNQTNGAQDANGRGPNLGCGSAITPLNDSHTAISDGIEQMLPWHRGGTLTDVGLAWGWRAISPRWRGLWGGDTPDHLPLDYDHPLMQKVVIILTDGENQFYDNPPSGPAGSDYTAHGRLGEGRLGTTSSSGGRNAVNNRTLAICNAMKAEGIILYTILFQVNNEGTEETFEACATTPQHYFSAPSNAELAQVFQRIAGELNNLRLAE